MENQGKKREFILSSQALHDLRNALNSILGYAQMLQDEELSNEQKKMTDSIENAALRIKALTGMQTNDVVSENNIEQGFQDNLKILIVDDNEDNRDVLALLLKKFQAELSFASNGYEALEIASQKEFDLIFIDFHMPELNGKEASKQIKQQTPKTKIAILSGDIEMIEKIEEGGEIFDYYLSKPFNKESVKNIIAGLTQNFHTISPNQLSIDDTAKLLECAKLGRLTCLEELIARQEDPLLQDFLHDKVERFAFEEIIKWVEK